MFLTENSPAGWNKAAIRTVGIQTDIDSSAIWASSLQPKLSIQPQAAASQIIGSTFTRKPVQDGSCAGLQAPWWSLGFLNFLTSDLLQPLAPPIPAAEAWTCRRSFLTCRPRSAAPPSAPLPEPWCVPGTSAAPHPAPWLWSPSRPPHSWGTTIRQSVQDELILPHSWRSSYLINCLQNNISKSFMWKDQRIHSDIESST